jgi:RNA ligase (TIGR02306 family)
MENQNSVCYVARINEIKPIEGADKIELAVVGGWNCVIQKDAYKVGDLVIVATTDAVIPIQLSNELAVTSYLRKGQRVRTVKLRGVYSECLIIPTTLLNSIYYAYNLKGKLWSEGSDMMELLQISKYEPSVKTISLGGGRKIKYQDNPNFSVYYKFPNIKNVPDMFTGSDLVEITRKIHGTNARYGIVKKSKLSIWDKIKRFFGDRWVGYEFVVGSHNVEKGSDSQGYYDTNVWYEIADKYNLKDKMWNIAKTRGADDIGSGMVLYGEIYGAGIQKGYDYGLNEIKFVGFDVIINGKYVDTQKAKYIIEAHYRVPYVPILYVGFWSKAIQDSYVIDNFIEGTKVPHEGVVVKEISGDRRKIAKVINPAYLIFGEKHDIGDSH